MEMSKKTYLRVYMQGSEVEQEIGVGKASSGALRHEIVRAFSLPADTNIRIGEITPNADISLDDQGSVPLNPKKRYRATWPELQEGTILE
jgi:hypothetical protein